MAATAATCASSRRVALHSRKAETKTNKWYLTVDETKDSLKGAAGCKYDHDLVAG
jgi:hypothetical protein